MSLSAGLVPDVEFSYINFYRRIITNTRNAEKQLEKMTLKRNQNEIEEKLTTLVQEEFFSEYPLCLPKYEFSAHIVPAKFLVGCREPSAYKYTMPVTIVS
jgi:hypothetical protein